MVLNKKGQIEDFNDMAIACFMLVLILIGMSLVFDVKIRDAQGEIRLAKEQIKVNPIMLNWLRTGVGDEKMVDMFALYGLEEGASEEGKEFKKISEGKAVGKTTEILKRVSSKWGISLDSKAFSEKGVGPIVISPSEVYIPGVNFKAKMKIPIAYNLEEKSVEVDFGCDEC